MENKWRIESDLLLVDESLLSTANGYIGVRGNFEEGYPSNYPSIRGTYINGFYDIVDIEYGESAYGFPKTAQKILNIIDAQTITLEIDGDTFSVFSGQLLDFKRELNIEKGYASRQIHWVSPKGHELKIDIKRMTSLTQLELMVIDYKVTSVNYNGPLRFISLVEGDVTNYSDENDPRVGSGSGRHLKVTHKNIENNRVMMTATTERSNLSMNVVSQHSEPMTYQVIGDCIEGTNIQRIQQGETIMLTKFNVYTDTIRYNDPLKEGKEILKKAISLGKSYWFEEQKSYLENFWKYAKVDILGEDQIAASVNYSVYQLLASAGKDPHSNVSAKGLSGEGYEGHYFWDTEIYMIPFFTLTNPLIAKNLMKFRAGILDSAKVEARNLGHKKGAKIPWRTISGSECSAYFPAGSAQYHINADVAYAYIQYFIYTKDLQMMCDFGLEVMIETARLWLDMGHYNSAGEYCLNTVTGPDEYTAIVNNNFYTNAMAKYHLEWTYKIAQIIEVEENNIYEILAKKIGLSQQELLEMKNASEAMRLPHSKTLNIDLQDDAMLDRATWDFDNTPKEHHPLLLHYHPLTIYRYNVLKQADTLLAHLLLDGSTTEIIENSFDYYEGITTHDSSLSPCIHSMVASRINKPEKAYHYFMATLRLDLDNLHNNTKDGLHIANAGGAYMTCVYGFGGLRIKENGLHFRPTMPQHWEQLTFRLNYQGGLVTITIKDTLIIESEKPIEVYVDGKLYSIESTLEVVYHGKH